MRRFPKPSVALLALASGMLAGHGGIAAADPASGAAGGGLVMLGDAADRLDLGTDLYLEVVLNGAATGNLAHFGQRDGRLYASAGTLRQLAFRLPEGSIDPIALDELPGVRVDYNAARQRVSIHAPLSLLDLDLVTLNQAESRAAPVANATPGALLNYNLYASRGSGNSASASAWTELRAFGDFGLLRNTILTRAIRVGGSAWRGDSVRLDTSWTKAFPERMFQVRLGDTLTGATDWSRPTRIAGIQVGSNFALQPYRITTPIPRFFGEAALPSAVELYINGIRQYVGEVAPGPFRIVSAPTISGSGMAEVVLTDVNGQSRSLSFPFYTSGELLAGGLTDWSAEVGLVRENYGRESFDYADQIAASGSWRHGLNDHFTAKAHGEASSSFANAGIGGGWLAGRAGVFSGSVAQSTSNAGDGTQYGLAYSWQHRRFRVDLATTRTDGNYRDLASLNGSPIATVMERAGVGYSSPIAGSLSLGYVRLDYPEADGGRYANAHWFRSFGSRLTVSASVHQNLAENEDRTFYLGLAWHFGDGPNLSFSSEHGVDGNRYSIRAGRPIPGDGGFGWRAEAGGGNFHGGSAELGYRGRYGTLRGGVYSAFDNHAIYASASGSLALLGGHLFAARRIDDAFAVVDTSGIAGVPVRLENRLIGVTNNAGMLLVTPLQPWQRNKIAIDPMALPASMRIERVNALAIPRAEAGTLVAFDIQPLRAASLIVVDSSGAPLPVGSTVQLASGRTALIGFDGMTYVESLDRKNELVIETPTGPCSAQFDYPQSSDTVPLIGPVTCAEITP